MLRATVIGAGIVGCATALALIQEGYAVIVVDPDAEGRAASWGNAGHIAVEQVAPLASMASIRSAPGRLFSRGGALSLPLSSMRDWAPFAGRMLRASTPSRFRRGSAALSGLLADALPAWRRLAAHIGRRDLLREEGHLLCWGNKAAARRGRAAWQAADIGTARLSEPGEAERRLLASALGVPPADAIWFEGTAQIHDLAQLNAALLHAIYAYGGMVLRDTATVERFGTAARARLANGHCLPDGPVVIAAGIASGGLMKAMDYAVPIIAERGYHIRAKCHDWPEGLPPVVFEDRSVIVTRYANSVQAASFVEFSRPDAPPDRAKWARLEQHVAGLGIPMSGPFSRWVGSRPTLPDYLPAIGRSRRADNLFYAFGHQHLGLTLGPLTGEIIAHLVGGRDDETHDVAPFDVERFE